MDYEGTPKPNSCQQLRNRQGSALCTIQRVTVRHLEEACDVLEHLIPEGPVSKVS